MKRREQAIDIVRNILEQDPRLVFAYLYGSFRRGEPFKDIDIGVYLKDADEDPFGIPVDLKSRLSRALKDEKIEITADRFDVKVLNDAPFTFLKRIFMEGILLMDHDPDLRTDLIEYVSLKYRECAGILAEASLL